LRVRGLGPAFTGSGLFGCTDFRFERFLGHSRWRVQCQGRGTPLG
jgi:hypothetical protein